MIDVGKKELTIGVHTYPFAVMLPPNSPSTFSGKYGGIAYYGKAKVDVPLATDKTVKNFFQVENWFDLNHYPQLKVSIEKICPSTVIKIALVTFLRKSCID